MHGWGVGTMAGVGVLAAWFVACAGETIPPIDDELQQSIEEVYDDGAGGQQGSAGGAGRGGSANTPGGGAAGAAGAAGAGGDEPAGGGAAGAGGGEPVGGGGGTLDPTVCNAYNDILVPSCGLSGCHNEGSSQGAFAIDGDEEAIFDFVDRASTQESCDLLFIDSADTEQSLILRRTDAQTPPGCGNLQMPLTGDLLDAEQVECLTEWLTQFAD